MSNIEKENLFIDLETNIDKAEHIAEKIISEYNLDVTVVDDLDEKVFAGNRYNIWMDMEILCDYIRLIRAGQESIAKAVGV